jgi:hypothetical protein
MKVAELFNTLKKTITYLSLKNISFVIFHTDSFSVSKVFFIKIVAEVKLVTTLRFTIGLISNCLFLFLFFYF